MPLPKSYDTKSAAEYLGVSLRSLNTLINRAAIIRYKVGGKWRYDEADLDNYVREQRMKALEAAERARSPKTKYRPRRHITTEEAIAKISAMR